MDGRGAGDRLQDPTTAQMDDARIAPDAIARPDAVAPAAADKRPRAVAVDCAGCRPRVGVARTVNARGAHDRLLQPQIPQAKGAVLAGRDEAVRLRADLADALNCPAEYGREEGTHHAGSVAQAQRPVPMPLFSLQYLWCPCLVSTRRPSACTSNVRREPSPQPTTTAAAASAVPFAAQLNSGLMTALRCLCALKNCAGILSFSRSKGSACPSRSIKSPLSRPFSPPKPAPSTTSSSSVTTRSVRPSPRNRRSYRGLWLTLLVTMGPLGGLRSPLKASESARSAGRSTSAAFHAARSPKLEPASTWEPQGDLKSRDFHEKRAKKSAQRAEIPSKDRSRPSL
eukprot:scaffold980_cov248-Pinguiococcus_pyrenoidosus.AAC.1